MTHKSRTRKFQMLVLFTLCLAVPLTTFDSHAQTTNATTVPRLVRYAGVARDLNGTPLSGVVGVTFALYAEQASNAALWMETQNVQADSSGRYSVLLGSTKPDGLPAELFAAEQARWIGVQIEQQAEQPRTLLVSAPYALKAGDAETLGGLPPSAFVQVASPAATSSSQSLPAVAAATPASSAAPNKLVAMGNSSSDVTTTGGTVNKIPLFTSTTNIQNSIITQSGSKVGIGTASPAFTLQVEGSNATTTGIQSVTTNTSTATNSFAAVTATSSKGVTTEMVADGLGTGPLKVASGYVGTYTDQPMGFITDNLERMRITKGGFVGIGTTTPTAWLQVNSQNSTQDGILANGFSAAPGSHVDGSNGITADGGTGDLTTDEQGNGGNGLVANGGASTSLSGTGVIANGASGVDTGEGGPGLVATGGIGESDGSGGIFAGGNFNFNGDGIDATAGSGVAGSFSGDVTITGNLSKSGGSFKIDHPLDPANKYLYHSFVESPDMKNIYDGVATLDSNGEAVIKMPEWFGVLNRDFRYQLTCIGAFAPVFVAEELAGNQFKIGGGSAGMRVSWQVTGIRQDAWANAHRIPVEELKSQAERGYYLRPELYGAEPEKQVEWARHPQMMKKMRERSRQMKPKQTRLTETAKTTKQ
jgi:trimeric autotransporter adhesin